MKKLYHLILIVATAVLTSCSTSQAGLSVGNMKNTECGNTTRSGYYHSPKIKLQRDGMNIHVTLTDYLINCGHPELYMDCRQEGKRLEMNVKRKEVDCDDGLRNLCVCPINIYFTMYDVEGDTFQLFLDDRDLGTLSFKEHSIIYVDAYTLDQAYEEGFDYQLELFGYDFYEMNQPDYTFNTYRIYMDFNKNSRTLGGTFQNFFLPCNAKNIEVKMDVEEDGTLVFTPLADGKPCDGRQSTDCYRRAYISFNVVNALKDSYHIKWNPHTSVVTEADGTAHEVTTYDYEGDISVGESIKEKLKRDNDIKVSAISYEECNPDGSLRIVMKQDENGIICNFQNLISGSGAELYADAVFDDNNNLVITIGNNKPAGTGFPSIYNLSFHIDNAFLNKCLMFIKRKDQGWDEPHDIYEGIITFSDNEAIIDFN